MKKIIAFLLVAVLALSGCQDSPKSQDIVGIWEAYDCKDRHFVGVKFYLYEDGHGVLRDRTGFLSEQVVYKVEGGKIYISDLRDELFASPAHIANIEIKGDTLIFQSVAPTKYWIDLGTITWKRLSGSS